MQCVILAGGLGTRMRPFTEGMPKALIPVGPAGVPFIDFQLAWLAGHGVGDVILSIGYRGEMLRDHVGAGERFGVPVRYVDEGSKLRGTAGALRLAVEEGVIEETFLVTYGDSFLPIDFGAVGAEYRSSGKKAAMTVLKNAGRWDASNVVFENGSLALYDKTRGDRPTLSFEYIDYGLTALSRSVVVDAVPPGDGVHDLATLFHDLSVEGELLGIEVQERFYEIGSPQGLADFSAWITARQPRPDGDLSWLRDV